MRRPRDLLLRWLLGVMFSLPLALVLWWQWVREPLIRGLAQAVGWISPWLWSDTVLSVSLEGNLGQIVSLLPPE